MEAQRLKRQSVDIVFETTATEYSPVYVGPQDGLKAADKILALPGQPNGIEFDQYSGYVTVDPNSGRALFYYFAESKKPSRKPLVLWLSGGPGCSSLGNGAMQELGPFRVNSDGKTLSENKYAWNNVANVIFLESPAGVGFSYSNTTSDYNNSGDARTAADTYTFLVHWLERFLEFKTRDFFITGESYAGHFVPQLSQLILQNNKITNQTVINLRRIAVQYLFNNIFAPSITFIGMFSQVSNTSIFPYHVQIGNAFVYFETGHMGMYDYLWTHAIISDETHEGIVSNCNFSSDAPVSETCGRYVEQAHADRSGINIYNIYAPVCDSSSSNAATGQYQDLIHAQMIMSAHT